MSKGENQGEKRDKVLKKKRKKSTSNFRYGKINN